MQKQSKTKQTRTAGDLWRFFRSELKPRGATLFTPFNIISLPIILLGFVLIILRLMQGLGQPYTNLSQDFPWGIWIGLDVMVGVAFASGAYIVTFMVYVLRAEKFYPIVRATVLNSFLAYVFYAGAILLDCGRWWNVANPIFGRQFGVNSVLFLVAWHFLLYILAALLEFSPVAAEWLGLKRARRILGSLMLGAVIFGVTLSTLHQSGLGALVMMATWKIHPLWYTGFIPILFFVSSVFAGLAMVIFEGSICQTVFAHQIDEEHHRSHSAVMVALAKICGVVMFAYCFLKVLLLVHEHELPLLNSPK